MLEGCIATAPSTFNSVTASERSPAISDGPISFEGGVSALPAARVGFEQNREIMGFALTPLQRWTMSDGQVERLAPSEIPAVVRNSLSPAALNRLEATMSHLNLLFLGENSGATEQIFETTGLQSRDIVAIELFPTAIVFVARRDAYAATAKKLSVETDGYDSIATTLNCDVPETLRGLVVLINEGLDKNTECRTSDLIRGSIDHEVLHTFGIRCYSEHPYIDSLQLAERLAELLDRGEWTGIEDLAVKVREATLERARSEILSYSNQGIFHLSLSDLAGHFWAAHLEAVEGVLKEKAVPDQSREWVHTKFSEGYRTFLSDSVEYQSCAYFLANRIGLRDVGATMLGVTSVDQMYERVRALGYSNAAVMELGSDLERALCTEVSRRVSGSAAHLPEYQYHWFRELGDNRLIQLLEAYLPRGAKASIRLWLDTTNHSPTEKALHRVLGLIDRVEQAGPLGTTRRAS